MYGNDPRYGGHDVLGDNGRGRALGNQAMPEMTRLFTEINKMRPGRPQVVVNHETIDADSSGQIVLPIKTSAPMMVEYFAVSIDDTPMYQLATVPIDVDSLRWQTEWDQTEIEAINGSGNVMVVFGSNGTLEVNYLGRAALIHQGSETTVSFTNRDTQNEHRIDIAMHGFLVTRQEMELYMKE
jgi:hypothetical protein